MLLGSKQAPFPFYELVHLTPVWSPEWPSLNRVRDVECMLFLIWGFCILNYFGLEFSLFFVVMPGRSEHPVSRVYVLASKCLPPYHQSYFCETIPQVSVV
ncbi:hypothetical protein GDO78_020701 [Eleutherodactylus coqui]|uniref:Uncharacterized protein n=1 Tax=Eleutherodactylus coqui TaxID=57060 RepID=A0A8J6BI86_ELECQ|nr:hypothetical protein GDO78_020701 [Eleutherodactylus coqui]